MSTPTRLFLYSLPTIQLIRWGQTGTYKVSSSRLEWRRPVSPEIKKTCNQLLKKNHFYETQQLPKYCSHQRVRENTAELNCVRTFNEICWSTLIIVRQWWSWNSPLNLQLLNINCSVLFKRCYLFCSRHFMYLHSVISALHGVCMVISIQYPQVSAAAETCLGLLVLMWRSCRMFVLNPDDEGKRHLRFLGCYKGKCGFIC